MKSTTNDPGTYTVNANGCTVYRTRNGNEAFIASFHTDVVSVTVYRNPDGNLVGKEYELVFRCGDETVHRSVSADRLEKFDYLSEIGDAFVLNVNQSRAGLHMANAIRKQAVSAEHREITRLDRLGWHNISGTHVYCAGSEVITGDSAGDRFRVDNALRNSYRFVYDDTADAEACWRYIKQMMDIQPGVTDVIVLTGLLGILRQLFLDAGIPVQLVLYVFGKTQSQKTTFVKLATMLYDRDRVNSDNLSGCMRVTSTPAALHNAADECKDTAFLLDDLCAEEDTPDYRKEQAAAYKLLRSAADGEPPSTAHQYRKFNCQLIITAEKEFFQKPSDRGRILEVPISEPLAQNGLLSEIQKTPLLYASFCRHFIAYLCENYEERVKVLQYQYESFRGSGNGRFSKYCRYADAYFTLTETARILLAFASEIGAVPQEAAKSLIEYYMQMLQKLVNWNSEQLDSCQTYKVPRKPNLSSIILSLYRQQKLKAADEKHIFASTEQLANLIGKEAQIPCSPQDIARYYRERDFSECFYSDGSVRKYRCNDGKVRRCLMLHLQKLQADAQKQPK